MNISIFFLFIGLVLAAALFIIYNILINRRWQKKLENTNALVKEAEAQLIHMEKMASLGTLAAGVAHEINNPLSFLIGNLEVLKSYIQQLSAPFLKIRDKNVSGEEVLAIIQESLDGALRIKKIVSDLRTFSRRSETQRISVDINQILESVLSIVWNEIKYKVTLVKDYQAKSAIFCDATQVSQVFLNIVINAAQSIASKGVITLTTSEDAKNVRIRITDTGCGIPSEVLPKIFDPFFSTKKSTGLGLSVSYNIIKQHGGSINVESKEGSGTTFVVELPKNSSVKDNRF